MPLSGTIFDIKKYAIHDGPGIRTTVFFQGCPLTCWWCHNPESQSHRPVLFYRNSRCMLCGACVAVCPQHGIKLFPSTNGMDAGSENPGEGEDGKGRAITDRSICSRCGQCAAACYYGAREISGREMTPAEVMAEIERDLPFYDQSGGGVTFSGGEPLLQPAFLAALLGACKQMGIHTVVDTCGYAAWDVIEPLVGEVDLFLYDLKLMDDIRHMKYTGVSNRRVLSNLQRLSENAAQIEIRIPLIPGINDDAENLTQTAAFIAGLPDIAAIELIAYHHTAAAKYESLDLPYKLPEVAPPSIDDMEGAASFFDDIDVVVKISNSRPTASHYRSIP